MYFNPKRLRRPEERVGSLSNAALPPPLEAGIDPDTELVGSLRARDERAFEQLTKMYYLPMLHLATSFVRSRDDADEVIQETWLAVLSGIDRFEARSSFKTWLFRILANRARTRAKREARTLPFSSLVVGSSMDAQEPLPVYEANCPAWTGAASRARTPESHLLAGELRVQIDAAIAHLPPQQQEVLTLRDVEGWSAGEVCNALELSETNQRVLLHRARVRVRNALSRYLDAGRRVDDVSLAGAW